MEKRIDKKELLSNERYQKIVALLDKHVEYIHEYKSSASVVEISIEIATDLFGSEVANDLIKEFKINLERD
jgi:hypothetical protein